MKYLRFTLKPLEPYFLGSERVSKYGDSSQLSLTDPYYLISEKIPSQTSLFGILRYIGIKSPKTSYRLDPEDQENIGRHSFQAEDVSAEGNEFGKIVHIGPLMISDENAHVLFETAPFSHQIIGERPHVYRKLRTASTTDGERWIPEDYDHKAWGKYQWTPVRADTGKNLMEEDLFGTVDQTGVNLIEGEGRRPSSFFKKQYASLFPDFAFCFEAALTDDAFNGVNTGFTKKGSKPLTAGKGHSGFLATWECIPQMTVPDRSSLLPELPLIVDGKEQKDACLVWCASDLLSGLEAQELKENCQLLLGNSHQHRDFSTVYSADGKPVRQKERYRKSNCVLRLLSAGSVLYFRNEEQLHTFYQKLHQDPLFEHGKIVGWNVLYAINQHGIIDLNGGNI